MNKENIDKAVKDLNAQYFEISSKKAEDVYKIVSEIYLKVKNTIRLNEYTLGLTNNDAYFL